jgi:SAM-dependent methyltransferase
MCNISGIIFGATNLSREEIQGKSVIEVGSKDVNGSLRSYVESRDPAEYVGVDIEMGPGVDILCSAEDIIEKFGKETFDIVISTELIEHVKDWRKVISNFKNICIPGGIILITTRSYGFKYHGYPHDFWRYELSDIKNIFSDCIIHKIEMDQMKPGVFAIIKKPKEFFEKDLANYGLYSIIFDKIVKEINEKDIKYYQNKKIKYKTWKLKFRNFLIKNILDKILITS